MFLDPQIGTDFSLSIGSQLSWPIDQYPQYIENTLRDFKSAAALLPRILLLSENVLLNSTQVTFPEMTRLLELFLKNDSFVIILHRGVEEINKLGHFIAIGVGANKPDNPIGITLTVFDSNNAAEGYLQRHGASLGITIRFLVNFREVCIRRGGLNGWNCSFCGYANDASVGKCQDQNCGTAFEPSMEERKQKEKEGLRSESGVRSSGPNTLNNPNNPNHADSVKVKETETEKEKKKNDIEKEKEEKARCGHLDGRARQEGRDLTKDYCCVFGTITIH